MQPIKLILQPNLWPRPIPPVKSKIVKTLQNEEACPNLHSTGLFGMMWGCTLQKKKKNNPRLISSTPTPGIRRPLPQGGRSGSARTSTTRCQVVSTVRLLPSEGRLLDPGGVAGDGFRVPPRGVLRGQRKPRSGVHAPRP